MKYLLLLLFLIPLGAYSQILVPDPPNFTSASQGDLYIDNDGIYYIGLQDGSLKEIGIVTQKGTSDGQTLAWNPSTGTWEARTPPLIRAAGKINGDGTAAKIIGATVARASGQPRGAYQITFNTPLQNANYIIQLTIASIVTGNNFNDDPDLSYRNQTATGFIVETGDNDNGGSDRDLEDFEFMFIVIAL